MQELSIEHIRALFNNGKSIWTIHVARKLQERGIFQEDISNAINNGIIIEQYPNDYPHPSCLIFGKDLNNNPLHIVVGSDGKTLYLVTAYLPDSEHFENDFTTRKEK